MGGYLHVKSQMKDMLRRENKLFILLFVVASLFFTACKRYKEYNVKEIATIRERCIKVSQTVLSQDEYYSIYQMANDSIINWSKNELGKWKYYGNLTDYQLDSIFCVNEMGDKIIFSILRRSVADNAVMDGISLRDHIWCYLENFIRKTFILP